jgi:uncharacterized protein YndB with AHSA1/START domain
LPVVSRDRIVPAAQERLWQAVADPECLPRWWPRVLRVEDVSESGWTTVLPGSNVRTLRADYTLLERERPRLLRWRQEVEESPFERILEGAVTDLELEPRGDGETVVRLTAELRLRGLSRLGGVQVRRATRRQLDEALAGLNALAESWRAES